MSAKFTLACSSHSNLVLPSISDVLSSQMDSKSCDKEISSQDTSVNHNSEMTECSDRYNNFDIRRQKIELAINELNMDEESIKDLKSAFSLEDKGGDVASALIRLSQKKELTSKQPHVMRAPITGPYQKDSALKCAIAHRNNHRRASLPPYYIPRQLQIQPEMSQSNSFRPATIRRTKEFTSIKIKLRQTEEFWEVLAITMEFEPRQVNMHLVKYPSKQSSIGSNQPMPDRDALLIEAVKVILVHSADGSIVEKTVSARSLIPLGGFAKTECLGVCQVGKGVTRIRILKLKI